MSYSLFSNLPAACKKDEVEEPLITFKTASGEALESQGQYYINFKFCTMDESLWHKFDHPFHILPHLTEPCILGMDFIHERYLIFNGRTRNIIYNYEGKEHLIRTSNPIIMNITIAKEILPINVDTSDAGRAEIIKNIIRKNRDVVALKLSELGRTTRVEHRIELEPGPPIRLPPYQLALHQRAIAKEQIEAMLLANVIRPSTSPYSAPVVLQKKPCGGTRFCVDYRQLNKQTIKDPYVMPRISDLLDELSGARYFSAIDIHSAYWQVPIAEEDKHKTAFTCHLGHFEFNVVSFGLCNAPATFMRLINDILRPVLGKFATAYLDDILCYSKTFSEHCKNLETIFDLLRKGGLKIKLEKCNFLKKILKYIGFLISKDGFSADPKGIEPIQKYPAPKNVDQLRTYLGMTSYFRKFIQGYSHIAHPLSMLIRKSQEWMWGEEQEAAFQALKQKLISPPILRYADVNLPYILDTDASFYAIGSVLSQVQNIDGKDQEVVIAYGGKQLTQTEKKWAVIEKEFYAIIHAIKSFKHYLYGSKITIRSDHAPLAHIMKSRKDPGGRLGRWSLLMQEYDADITYRPGKKNGNADGISRIPPPEEEAAQNYDNDDVTQPFGEEIRVHLITAEIVKAQQEDDYCKKLMKESLDRGDDILQAGEESLSPAGGSLMDPEQTAQLGTRPSSKENFSSDSGYAENIDEDTQEPQGRKEDDAEESESESIRSQPANDSSDYESEIDTDWTEEPEQRYKILENGILATEDGRLIIPQSLRNKVLERFHSHKLAGHLGVKKTLNKIKKRFYWRLMNKDITKFIKRCKICALRKAHGGTRAPLQSIPPPKRVFHTISIDVIGPINLSSSGNQYILTITEHATRYVFAVAMPDQTAETVAAALINTIFLEHGVPEIIISDRGTNFRSELIAELCKQLGVKQIFTTPYNPKANGTTEKYNGVIMNCIVAFTYERPQDWDKYLKFIIFAINTSDHTSLEEIPFYLLYGRDAREPGDPHEPSRYKLASNINTIFAQIWRRAQELAREKLIEKQEKQKKYYDKGTKLTQYEIGDQVLLRVRPNLTGKIKMRWSGPYIVIGKMKNAVNYKIKHIETQEESSAHVNRMKKFETDEETRKQEYTPPRTNPGPTSVDVEGFKVPEKEKKERRTKNIGLTKTEAEKTERTLILNLPEVVGKINAGLKEKTKTKIIAQLEKIISNFVRENTEDPESTASSDNENGDPLPMRRARAKKVKVTAPIPRHKHNLRPASAIRPPRRDPY